MTKVRLRDIVKKYGDNFLSGISLDSNAVSINGMKVNPGDTVMFLIDEYVYTGVYEKNVTVIPDNKYGIEYIIIDGEEIYFTDIDWIGIL